MFNKYDKNDDSISIRDYIDMKVDLTEKLLCTKLGDMDAKTYLAKESMEHRLEGMNEFRESLKDQTARFLTRDEYLIEHKRLEKDVQEIRDFKISLESVASQKDIMRAYIVSGISICIGIASLIISIVVKFI
jgi:hypothetical protein